MKIGSDAMVANFLIFACILRLGRLFVNIEAAHMERPAHYHRNKLAMCTFFSAASWRIM